MHEDEMNCEVCGDMCTTGVETETGVMCIPCADIAADAPDEWCDFCDDYRPHVDGVCQRCEGMESGGDFF